MNWLKLGWHHKPADQVRQHPGEHSAEGEEHEDDTHNGGIDAEAACNAAADAREHLVGH